MDTDGKIYSIHLSSGERTLMLGQYSVAPPTWVDKQLVLAAMICDCFYNLLIALYGLACLDSERRRRCRRVGPEELIRTPIHVSTRCTAAAAE